MATFDVPMGPELFAQVAPVTPVIAQVAATGSVGVTPPEGPVTVAVKVIIDPRVTVPELGTIATIGWTLETVVVKAVVGVFCR